MWFQSVCLLMLSLSAYRFTLFSLILDVGYLLRLLQQSSATAYFLGHRISPHSHHYWPWMLGISSRPLAAPAPHSCNTIKHILFAEEFCLLWDGWMASLTRWMWVSVNSESWWWTGKPGVLQFVGSQRVGHDWATDLWSLCLLWGAVIIMKDFSTFLDMFSSVQ